MKKKHNLEIKYKLFIGICISIFTFVFLSFSIKRDKNLTMPEKVLKDGVNFVFNIMNLPFNLDSSQNINVSEKVIQTFNEEEDREKEELKKLLKLNETLTDFECVNATTIIRNKSYWFDTITINKGSKDGIDVDMAVMGLDGLIGKVKTVSYNTSEVKLVTSNDINNKISVSIDNGEQIIHALMTGMNDNHKLIVTGVDKLVKIEPGMSVYTSGLGGVFPSGLYIGTVEKIESEEYDMSKQLELNVVQDFNNIRYVSVLKRGKSNDK